MEIYVTGKSKNNVQDAHEGIRPSDVNLEPDMIKSNLSNEQYRLYKLIWERFLVSQLAAMKYDQMQIEAINKNKKNEYKFKGTINKITFDGYYKVFKDEDEIKTVSFPTLNEGDESEIKKLNIKEGITKPPSRYSEASLVKKLESEGIGRPSTYASIVETLKTRHYVEIVDKRFHPTVLGYEVKTELEKNFKNIMNIKFTANMEKELDDVESGIVDWKKLLNSFYSDLDKELHKYEKNIQDLKEKRIESDVLDSNNKPMILKTGRFGKYLVSEDDSKEKISLSGVAISQEEMDAGKVHVKEAAEKIKNIKKGLLTDFYTEDGSRYLLKVGKYGEYLESENYEKDDKRMPLPLIIKNKYKKNQIDVIDGQLQIKDELLELLLEDQRIIEAAGKCEKCGKPFEIKVGRFGKFLACTGYPECKNIKKIPKNK